MNDVNMYFDNESFTVGGKTYEYNSMTTAVKTLKQLYVALREAVHIRDFDSAVSIDDEIEKLQNHIDEIQHKSIMDSIENGIIAAAKRY